MAATLPIAVLPCVVMQGGEGHADRGIGRVLGLSAHHGDPGRRPPVRRQHGRRLRKEPVRNLQSAKNHHVQPAVRYCARDFGVPEINAGCTTTLTLRL